ncbi:GDP-fucose protein O-fucosyltransferase 2 [Echinococcus granulosus]|uniref:GDP-fucose protein O-fucosyltransferase 2 n=1 Tax=Echinococcus granulosus TaxID=6210 RepID=A0A068WF09_ECHGR|nr:GDP-fucose protein O-fucosyltransferase 2 [Echinococcus granulosus]CDS17021.1 GDP fucose protein O fucosyltransferase 2 [Echinococcus granulosus]
MRSYVIVLWNILFLAPHVLSLRSTLKPKYLIYTVNENEGFNLRRDVYVRVANLIRVLRDSSQYPLNDLNRNFSNYNWTLVLPPWGQTFHWRQQNSSVHRAQPWSTFFNVESLKLLIPVIEYDEFLQQATADAKKPSLDVAFLVKQFDLSQTQRGIRLETPKAVSDANGYTNFMCDDDQIISNIGWTPDNVTHVYFDTATNESALVTDALHCLHGALYAVELAGFLSFYIEEHPETSFIYIGEAENLISGVWSEWSEQYWTARRSMEFAHHLISLGDTFRRAVLNSEDDEDRTVPPPSWLYQPWPRSPARGGPYLGLHWRRGDFPHSTSPLTAAMQTLQAIQRRAEEMRLPAGQTLPIFLATDADSEDIIQLEQLLSPHKVYRFTPEMSMDDNLLPGELAIIDQWICAHARLFVGSVPSTFTFRIAEEREIMSFPAAFTFNSLCPVEGADVVMLEDQRVPSECEGLTPWSIVLEPRYTINISTTLIKTEL